MRDKKCLYPIRESRKTMLLRKSYLFILMAFFCTFAIAANDFYSQRANISLNVKNTTIKNALDQLERSTDYYFLIMDEASSELNKRVTVQSDMKPVREVLNSIFENTDLSYVITNKQITVQRNSSAKAASTARTTDKNQSAQQQPTMRRITGTVLDTDGMPLVGASVVHDESKRMTAVDANGNFELFIPYDAAIQEIIISYIGFTTKKVKLVDKDRKYNIVLEADKNLTDEVVVTGLFPRKKEGFSGSTITVSKEELRRAYTGNIFTTLTSIDASFKLNDNIDLGSDPNKIAGFTVRGRGSFSPESTMPLFILDGFEISEEKFFDLSIDRIESITLLKDASSTILYGSRASNGVVVIETIQPKEGEIRVSYNFRGTLNVVDLRSYNMMDAREKLEFERLSGFYDQYDLTNPLYQPQLEFYIGENIKANAAYQRQLQKIAAGVETDWLAQPVHNTFSHSHYLYAEGGADAIRYAINLSYSNNEGVMKKSNRDNFEIGNTFIYRLKEKLVIRNQLSYSYNSSNASPYGVFSQYVKLNPSERLFDKEGKSILFFDVPNSNDKMPNPLYNAGLPNESKEGYQTIQDNLSIDWRILPELRLRGDLSFMKRAGTGRNYLSAFHTSFIVPSRDPGTTNAVIVPIEERGRLSLSNNDGYSLETKITATYNKIYNKVHGLYLGLGASFRQEENELYGFHVTGFTSDRFKDPAYAIQYDAKKGSKAYGNEDFTRTITAFGTANYIYDDRYFADISFNSTGSSKFGADQRFGNFWSVGAGWNIHREKFMPKLVNMLRVRASYGSTGNQSFTANQARSSYKFKPEDLYNKTIPALLQSYGNEDLKWETTTSLNIGLDYSMFNDRAGIRFDYYNRESDNTISHVTVAPSLGFPGNGYTSNIGTIRNRGVELDLTIVPVRTGDWDVSINVQAVTNKSKILKISNALDELNKQKLDDQYGTPEPIYKEGHSIYNIYAVPSLGIDPGTGREVFLKKDGTLTYTYDTDDKVACGDAEEDLRGILGLNVNWKGINFNCRFNYKLGADYYNSTLANRIEGASPSFNADKRVLANRWKNPGDMALFKDIRDQSSLNNKVFQSSRFIQKENLLECSTISLNYDFPRSITKQLGVESLRLTSSANNLFRFSTVKQERGVEYPFAYAIMFGLNISL